MATNMHVRESGTPGDPAVVFLHGAGASGLMWRHHVARLDDRFHCLAPDLPGFGQSNRLAPLTVDKTADLIAELIEARVPARRAHVVGLSWGGAVTHRLLGRHPELVDRAVIDCAGVLTARGGPLVLLGDRGGLAVSPHAPGDRPVQPNDRDGRDGTGGSAGGVAPSVPAGVRRRLQGRRLRRRAQRDVADPAHGRRGGDGNPPIQCGTGGAHGARGGTVRARRRARLAGATGGAPRPDGRGLAHRAGAPCRARRREGVA